MNPFFATLPALERLARAPLGRLATFTFGLVLSGSALAGDGELDVATGLSGLSRADALLSPLAHRGALPHLALGWSSRGEAGTHDLSFDLAMGATRSQPAWSYQIDGETRTTDASAITIVDLQYAYGRKIQRDTWTLHVGATLAGHTEDIATVYSMSGLKTYLGAFELGPWAELRLPLSERVGLELQGRVPLLTWVARNPYALHGGDYLWNNRDNDPVHTIVRYIGDGRLHTLYRYQALHLQVAVCADLSERSSVVIEPHLDLLAFSLPRPVLEAQLGMNAGFRRTF